MNIEKLVNIAQKEEIPDINVSGSIFFKIQYEKNRKTEVKTMGIIASIAGIAASIILIFSVIEYKNMHNPLMELYRPITINSLY